MDAISYEFIKQVEENLEDPEYYKALLLECKSSFANFISRNSKEIKERLLKKLEKGAYEHGAPVYLSDTITKELEYEYLDILGWTLVRKFNERRKEGRRYAASTNGKKDNAFSIHQAR